MDVSVPTPDLEGKKKTLVLSTLGLAALAAGGEGYRRRGESDSSDWAKKGLVLVAVLAALGALGVGVRRRRAQAEPEAAVAEESANAEETSGADEAAVAEESASAEETSGADENANAEPKKQSRRAKGASGSVSED